jgi:hypothetical protein
MNNIVVLMRGGLSNQMFQFAYGKTLSQQYNMNLVLDTSFLENKNTGVTLRDYDLDIFNISSNKQSITDPIRIIEHVFQYTEMLSILPEIHPNRDLYIEGYFQSYKYFDTLKSQINNIFTINWDLSFISKIKSDILNNNSVCIHVRRGDYLKTSFHGTMEMDYYTNAMNIIETSVSDPIYYIFSEDIEWSKQNFAKPNMVIVSMEYAGEKAEGHFELMRSCKHFIVANSSFSWWTAYLSENPNKIVISPKKWFNNDINTNDLMPESWIRI